MSHRQKKLTNNEYIIKRIDTINFWQKLIDDCIMNSCGWSGWSSLFTNCIEFIKNDNMKSRIDPSFSLFLFSFLKKLSNISFWFAHVFVQNFWTVDNFWFPKNNISMLLPVAFRFKFKLIATSGWLPVSTQAIHHFQRITLLKAFYQFFEPSKFYHIRVDHIKEYHEHVYHPFFRQHPAERF